VPIDDPERVTRFTIDAFFQWHFLNAYERGNEVVVDVVRFPDFESNNWFGKLIEPHRMSPYVAGEPRVVRSPPATDVPRCVCPRADHRELTEVSATTGFLSISGAGCGCVIRVRLPARSETALPRPRRLR